MVRLRLTPRPQRRRRLYTRMGLSVVLLLTAIITAFTCSRLFAEPTPRAALAQAWKKSVPDNEGSVSVVVNTGEGAEEGAVEEDPHAGEEEEEAGEHSDCETNMPTTFDKVLWGIFYALATLYVFLALAIVCDDFFVASLEVICDELDLTPDVAGATFMAAGSSAPELFTSIVGVFVEESDVGIGTILGSAVFNILVIIGLTALLAGQVLKLDWKPLARDSSFYCFSILLILLMFSNHVIDWFEAAILLIAYALYLVIMKYNEQLMLFMDRLSSSTYTIPVTVSAKQARGLGTLSRVDENGEKRPPSLRVVAQLVVANIRFQKHAELARQKQQEQAQEEEEDDDMLAMPDEAKDQLLWALALPLIILFKLTIPDCSTPKYRKYYIVTFTMSIVWIGLSCFFMADWARALGCILNINPAIMGLTLLAAGTSVPDALSSLFVAQDGEGDMAVSNAIGSNVFDVLLGLGLPWMVSIAMTGGEPVPVKSDGIVKATVMLFVVLVFVIGTLVLSGWKLSPRVGAAMFGMYFVFVVFSLLDEYFDIVDKMSGY